MRAGFHGAASLENRAFLNDEIAGLQIAQKHGFAFQYQFFLGADVSVQMPGQGGGSRQDVALDAAGGTQNQGPSHGHRAPERAFDAQIMLHFEFADDTGAFADEGHTGCGAFGHAFLTANRAWDPPACP
jgi:hypothetical protein